MKVTCNISPLNLFKDGNPLLHATMFLVIFLGKGITDPHAAAVISMNYITT